MIDSSSEARSRRRFAEQQISLIRELVSEHPDAIPDLYTGYKNDVQNVVDRLYVPNLEVAGSTVRATTPRKYRGANAIGVMAVYSGEQIVMDRGLIEPSERQRQQHQNFLATHMTVSSGVRIGQQITNSMPDSVTETLAPRSTAGSWQHGYVPGVPFFDKEGHASYVRFGYRSPLAVNIGIPQDVATLMHEVDHLVETDEHGISPDDYRLNRARNMISEQRGYHVGLTVADYLFEHDLPTPPHLAERRSTMRDLDTIRAEHLGEGPHFGFTPELMQAYQDAHLLDFVLDKNYQGQIGQ